jgi:hypothetical protein
VPAGTRASPRAEAQCYDSDGTRGRIAIAADVKEISYTEGACLILRVCHVFVRGKLAILLVSPRDVAEDPAQRHHNLPPIGTLKVRESSPAPTPSPAGPLEAEEPE